MKRLGDLCWRGRVGFLNHLLKEKPWLLLLAPLVPVAWSLERWIFPHSNWVPIVFSVSIMIQYEKYERQVLVDDLKEKWRRLTSKSTPITPLEPCDWLNKLLMDIWPNYIEPKLSTKFSSIIERRVRHGKPKFLESIKLEDFTLGSGPPSLGLQGIYWSTSENQPIMRLGFDWKTSNMSILLLVKFGKTLGTVHIIVNSLILKGCLIAIPILNGRAMLYSFETNPEVKIGVAFGSSGSVTLPSTELPGVSAWLVKVLTDTLTKTMVEPRRKCFTLPPKDFRKHAVGGILSVTIVSGSNLNGLKARLSDGTDIRTFVEIGLANLTRRTDDRRGTDPRWDTTFNMVVHDDAGILKLHLHESTLMDVGHGCIASCEIKFRYVEDDSTIFWAMGRESSILAEHVEQCGKEVEMVVPFEGNEQGEVTVRLVLNEWQFSDGATSSNKTSINSSQLFVGSSTILESRTGKKLQITVMEGWNLLAKDKSGKCDPYVKLHYGKKVLMSRTIPNDRNPVWSQKFVFDELIGEYLKIKCYSADTFTDEFIGSVRCHLEGLTEGLIKDVWVPLEKVHTGELRIQIQAVKSDDLEGLKSSKLGTGNGLVELVLVEARYLVAADISGTSDPFVTVVYGDTKRRSRVIYKTLKPEWNETFKFPDDGSKLVLHVKDHNAILPTTNIGYCEVDYQEMPLSEAADKWIPLQGVTNGEIHVSVTRRVSELKTKPDEISKDSTSSKAIQISSQVRELMVKSYELVEDGDYEGFKLTSKELENLENIQEEYMLQLERERTLLLSRISDLAQSLCDLQARELS